MLFPRAIFGRNIFGIRVLDAILLLAAAVCLARLISAWSGRIWGYFGALLYIFIYLAGWFWNTATSDSYGALFTIIAASLIVRRGRVPYSAYGLAGALAGLVAMYKITLAAMFFPLALFVLIAPGLAMRRRVGALAALTGAAGLMVALWLALLALNHALAPFLEINGYIQKNL